MQLQIAPPLLAADFLHLEKDVRMLNEAADLIHLDIMDGTLVPNLSFGFSVVEPLSRIATIPLDTHLMIINPDKYFARFAALGVRMLSFHLEAARLAAADAGKWLRMIRELGPEAGLAINPDMPVEAVYPYLEDADFILIMSVFAGFGGQKFIPESLERISAVKDELSRIGRTDIPIEVDGGIGPENAAHVVGAGASILVDGSAVFKAPDPQKAILYMKG